MGFNPFKTIERVFDPVIKQTERLIGPTATRVLYPPLLFNELGAKAFDKLFHPTPKPPPRLMPGPVAIQPGTYPQFGPQPKFNVTYGAPSYSGGYGGGGSYDPYSYQPTYNPYTGGSPWDYSMGSQTFLTPQFQGYSEAPPNHTWEDLALGILPLFL